MAFAVKNTTLAAVQSISVKRGILVVFLEEKLEFLVKLPKFKNPGWWVWPKILPKRLFNRFE